MAFPLDQVSGGKDYTRVWGHGVLEARLGAIAREEKIAVDAVGNGLDVAGVGAQADRELAQRIRNRNHSRGPSKCPSERGRRKWLANVRCFIAPQRYEVGYAQHSGNP